MQLKLMFAVVFVTCFSAAWASGAAEKSDAEELSRFPPLTFHQNKIMDDFVRNDFLERSRAMGEEDISQRIGESSQIVRLTYLPARLFYTEAVRIEMAGDRIAITVKRASKPGRRDLGDLSPEEHAELTPQQWAELQARLAEADFWNLPTSEESSGWDGMFWVIEAVSGDRYHIVCRWSPGRAQRYNELTDYILELAGILRAN